MDLDRTGISIYDVTWNTYDMGALDETGLDLELITKEIKTGTTGALVLGKRIIGLQGTISVSARELDDAYLRKIIPWAPVAPGSIPMVPVEHHKDLYDYAQILRLHPHHLPAADKSQDIVLTKAVPSFPKRSRNGEDDDVDEIEFSFFPDRAKLALATPVVDYGHFGPDPV